MSRYTQTQLQPDCYYHIYNRGNNHGDLFLEERNYRYFMELYVRHVYCVADTYAYCLLKNHFHLLVRVRTEEEYMKTFQVFETWKVSRGQVPKYNPSRRFSNLFNAYTKAINKAYGRTGSLFEKNFKRIHVTKDAHFCHLIRYIHFNPQKHDFVEDFRDWPWSSYHALRGNGVTRLRRGVVISWFGGIRSFEEFHKMGVNEDEIATLVGQDDI